MPVFPGLEAVAVEEKVQRLPIVEDFITVMYYVCQCAEYSAAHQGDKYCLHAVETGHISRSTAKPNWALVQDWWLIEQDHWRYKKRPYLHACRYWGCEIWITSWSGSFACWNSTLISSLNYEREWLFRITCEYFYPLIVEVQAPFWDVLLASLN